jgi:hypothetical protein
MTYKSDQPLKCTIEDEQLVIRIGIDILTYAFETSEVNNPYDEDKHAFIRKMKVVNPLEFAEDVCRSMCDESETGSTPLTEFIDAMCIAACEDGSIGVDESVKEPRS